jgi:RIO kinase 1
MAIQKNQITDKKVVMNSLDNTSFTALTKMKDKGIIDYIGGVIQSGKESNIFYGTNSKNEPIIIKIYLISSNSFNNMIQYIQGDPRFIGLSSNKRKVIFEWAKKEYSNLMKCIKVGMDVPNPYFYMNNVLIMEPILKDNLYAPPLFQTFLEDPHDFFKQLKHQMRLMVKSAKLIHADLSEYNILVTNDKENNSKQKPIIIDVGQSVLISHPKSSDFFKRDIENIVKYFNKNYDLNINNEDLIKELTE